MKQLNLKAINFRPNLRILKNYIITFDDNLIELFDLNGNLLDNVKFTNRNIVNIEIINDNYIIVATSISILIMKINFDLLVFIEVLILKEPFKNICLIKKKNLLIIDSIYKIKIFDIINLDEKPIQTIYIGFNNSFLILNQNIFIIYNYENISFYQNIKGTKIYQLSSKLKLIRNKCLTKLNGKILLILLHNEILFTLNLRNMEIKQKIFLFQIINGYFVEYESFFHLYFSKFSGDYNIFYKNKNNIYLYNKNNLIYIKYINNEFQFIKTFEFDELKAIDYISNKYIKLKNIEINCIFNFIPYNKFYDIKLSDYENGILYYRPIIETKKALNVKKFFFKKESKNKNILINNKKAKKYKDIFIKKKNIKVNKIVNYSKSFKKKYR